MRSLIVLSLFLGFLTGCSQTASQSLSKIETPYDENALNQSLTPAERLQSIDQKLPNLNLAIEQEMQMQERYILVDDYLGANRALRRINQLKEQKNVLEREKEALLVKKPLIIP